jgi:AcrR family transcriptional regulator
MRSRSVDLRKEAGRTTREQLLSSATALFARQGFERTSIEQLLRETGVSKGALYHHFRSKEAVFRAVVVRLEERISVALTAAAGSAATPLEALENGCAAWLRLARNPEVRQIVLIDAPSVMGWQAWRELDEQHGFGLLKIGLAAAAPSLTEDRLNLCSHMLLAMLIEAGLLVARSSRPAKTELQAKEILERVLRQFVER